MWANDIVTNSGRWWGSADRATLTDFGDCCRVDLHWNDGGHAYVLEDTRDEATQSLARYGFSLDGAASATAAGF
jgi:hypothetical protein